MLSRALIKVHGICRTLEAYVWYDDCALQRARALVCRLGNEKALSESRLQADIERKGRRGEHKQVYRAVVDICRPEMLYHL